MGNNPEHPTSREAKPRLLRKKPWQPVRLYKRIRYERLPVHQQMEIAKQITEEHKQLKIIWQYAEAPKPPKKNIPIGMPYMSLSDYKKSGATRYRKEYLYQLAQMGSDELPVHW